METPPLLCLLWVFSREQTSPWLVNLTIKSHSPAASLSFTELSYKRPPPILNVLLHLNRTRVFFFGVLHIAFASWQRLYLVSLLPRQRLYIPYFLLQWLVHFDLLTYHLRRRCTSRNITSTNTGRRTGQTIDTSALDDPTPLTLVTRPCGLSTSTSHSFTSRYPCSCRCKIWTPKTASCS